MVNASERDVAGAGQNASGPANAYTDAIFLKDGYFCFWHFRMPSTLKRAGVIVLFFVVLTVPVITFGTAIQTYAFDMEYLNENKTAGILRPKYWTVTEEKYIATNGATRRLVVLKDQAEQGSRIAKYVYLISSTPSGIFDLPVPVVTRVSQKDLVNYYIDQALRSSVGARVISASIKDRNGEKVYSVEWSRLSAGKIRYRVFDEFIFHGDTTYQVHAEYSENFPVLRERITRIVQSIRFIKN